MAKTANSTGVRSILDGIDFSALGLSRNASQDLIKRVVLTLSACRHMTVKEVAEALDLTYNYVRDNGLTPAKNVGLIQADESGRPCLWSFAVEDAEQLKREHPNRQPSLPTVEIDRPSALKEIEIRAATGLSPKLCDDFKRIVLALPKYGSKKTLTVDEIVKRLDFNERRVRSLLRVGEGLDELFVRQTLNPGRRRDGSKTCREPDRWTIRDWALPTLAEQFPAGNADSPASPLESLNKRQRRLLERAKWGELGKQQARRVAHLIASIIFDPVLSDERRGIVMGCSAGLVGRAKRNARNLGFASFDATDESEWPSSMIKKGMVHWEVITANQIGESESPLDLSISRRVADLSEEPLSDPGRLTQDQQEQWEKASPEGMGLASESDKRRVLHVIAHIGASRRCTINEVARDAKVSPHTLRVWFNRFLRKAGLIDVEHANRMNRPGQWTVNWEKIEAAGKPKKRKADAAASNGKKATTRQRKSTAGEVAIKRPAATISAGQSAEPRNRTCKWLKKWQSEHPGSSLAQAVKAYNREEGETLSYGAAKAALRRRRRGEVRA